MAAGHFRLGSLVAIVDRNQLSIDGATEDLMGIEPLAEKFASFRWQVQRIDGHDLNAILDAFDALDPPGEGPPQVIIADTVKGRGVQRMEGDIGWHVGHARRRRLRRRHGRAAAAGTAAAVAGAGPRPTATARSTSTARPQRVCSAAGRTRPDARKTAKDRATGHPGQLASPPSWPARSSPTWPTTDPRIVVLTADLANANRTIDFAQRHPDRFFNMGIAEQNMISVAAGHGLDRPDPVRRHVRRLRRPPRAASRSAPTAPTPACRSGILGHHSGMSLGFYGTSHHSLEDLAIMRSIADLTVVCAADANQLRAILRASLNAGRRCTSAWAAAAIPRSTPRTAGDFAFGRAVQTAARADDLTMITTGSQVHASLAAADALAAGRHRRPGRRHAHHQAHSTPTRSLAAARETGAVLTVEEHNITGGLGSAVAEVLADAGVGHPVPAARRAGRARPARAARRSVRALPAGRGRDRRAVARELLAALEGDTRHDRGNQPAPRPAPPTPPCASRARAVIPGGMYGHLSANALPPRVPAVLRPRARARRSGTSTATSTSTSCAASARSCSATSHPKVEAAVAAQRAKGDTMSGPGAAHGRGGRAADRAGSRTPTGRCSPRTAPTRPRSR